MTKKAYPRLGTVASLAVAIVVIVGILATTQKLLYNLTDTLASLAF